MSIFDDIRRDLEAGTPGPWKIHNCESYGDRSLNFHKEVWNDDTDVLVTTEVTRAFHDGGTANVRRIARVPELERIALAAEELAAAVDHERNMVCQDFDMQLQANNRVDDALAKLREASK